MSYITFDYQCNACGVTVIRLIKRDVQDEQDCKECGSRLTRLMAAPITTFKHNDRSAIKSKKAVSLRDPHGSGKKTQKDWEKSVY